MAKAICGQKQGGFRRNPIRRRKSTVAVSLWVQQFNHVNGFKGASLPEVLVHVKAELDAFANIQAEAGALIDNDKKQERSLKWKTKRG